MANRPPYFRAEEKGIDSSDTLGAVCSQAMRYARCPSAPFSVITSQPRRFLTMPEIAPRTLWACQPVPAIIWAMVAPPGLRIASMIAANLVPGRRVCGMAHFS